MTFIRYKTFGKTQYAYKITPYWDPKTKKPKQKTQYLGVVIDKEKQIFQKNRQTQQKEKVILDFGDTYLLNEFLTQTGFTSLIQQVFGQTANTLLALISYRLCHNAAMMYAQKWLEGSYLSVSAKHKNLNLTSQRVSTYLQDLSDETLQRRFFESYMQRFSNAKHAVVIDATSLPNQIHDPLTAWGRSGEEIDKQVRFILAVDRDQRLPLFFRLLAGNIIDVSTLQNTLYELKHYGVEDAFLFLDAGFYSDDNIKDMYKRGLDFVVRLPSGRKIYKQLIRAHGKELEAPENIVRYGERGLFVKEVEFELVGKVAYAYLVLDPVRRGREISRFMLGVVEDGAVGEEVDYGIINKGVMVVVSSFRVSKEEIVPSYYVRQAAETFFGFAKDDLAMVPLRVHSQKGVRGFLFLQFLTLIAFIQLKNSLGKNYTVAEVLLTMRNLKCKVYDKEIMVEELTKDQKEIAEALKIIMPKTLGI